MSPVSSGNRKRHVQTYSWPVELELGIDLLHYDLAHVWLVNPQIAGFRQPSMPAQFARARVPPDSWTVLPDGSSCPMQCAHGHYLHEFDTCAPCAVCNFQSGSGGLQCAACAPQTTTAGPGTAGAAGPGLHDAQRRVRALRC